MGEWVAACRMQGWHVVHSLLTPFSLRMKTNNLCICICCRSTCASASDTWRAKGQSSPNSTSAIHPVIHTCPTLMHATKAKAATLSCRPAAVVKQALHLIMPMDARRLRGT
jgi:hypothetical protein